MPEIRIGFVRIKRDTGSEAVVRADSITHILHNTSVKKVAGENVETAMLSLHLGQTLVIHTQMKEQDLLDAMASAMGVGKITPVET